jgi:hypothetical protein
MCLNLGRIFNGLLWSMEKDADLDVPFYMKKIAGFQLGFG